MFGNIRRETSSHWCLIDWSSNKLVDEILEEVLEQTVICDFLLSPCKTCAPHHFSSSRLLVESFVTFGMAVGRRWCRVVGWDVTKQIRDVSLTSKLAAINSCCVTRRQTLCARAAVVCLPARLKLHLPSFVLCYIVLLPPVLLYHKDCRISLKSSVLCRE